jgi:hypothetical protein
VESIVSKLLAGYESGHISRRDLIRTMAALVVASEATAAAGAVPFQSKFLEHVSISTAHPQKLADWYKDALNLHQRPNQPDGAIRLGLEGHDRTLIVFRDGKVNGIIDHFAIAVEPYDRKALTEEFKRRSIPTTAEGEFMITDPEGNNCQLMADGSKK